MRALRAFTAAAQGIKLSLRGKANKPPTERWQQDAWDMFDLIPEVSQSATFLGNVVGGVRLFVAEVPDEDAEEPPGPAPEGTKGLIESREVLRRLREGSQHGGMSGLLAASVLNLKVPGEYYLMGEPPKAPDPITGTGGRDEQWWVKSTSEVTVEDKTATIKDTPGDKGRKVKLPAEGQPPGDDDVFLLRVWDRHPRYGALARSSLRAALEQCDELLLLGRCVRVAARRFLAGNGMLAVPSELELPGPPAEGDEVNEPKVSRLMDKLGTAMIEAMMDESNPDSLVPIMTMGDGEILQKLQHLSFGAALDPEIRALLIETKSRLASALDLPIEQLTGIAQVNHWGAWQIDSASWARYGQPTTRLIVQSWTEGLLWPMLEDNYGIPREDARRLMLWFDPADAIMDPDESKTADELHDRFTISDEAYRRRKGANEDEAPTPEEIEERIRRRSRPTSPNEPVPNDGEVPEATARSRPVPAVTAAARRPAPLGRRLMEIDRDLRTRLETECEATLRRAMQAAGARVRTRAHRDANITAALSGVPNGEVCARLGWTVVAALGLGEEELVNGEIDEMQDRYDALVASGQASVLALLAAEFDLEDAEADALQARQDRGRQEGWAFLAVALLSLARGRLRDPAPSALPQGEAPAVSSLVPTGVVRESLAVAGGGVVENAPAGGVATGVDVLGLWAAHGRVVDGWEWVYGMALRRQEFEPHERLDGERFASWQDEALLVDPEHDWLGVTHYRPGDHDGCSCDFVPLLTERGE